MKILVLTKRQYMAKDLIDDAFGRLWHLPNYWAQQGHEVNVFCLSYAAKSEGLIHEEKTAAAGSIAWRSFNAGPARIAGLLKFEKKIKSFAATFQPDIVIASSDSIYVVLGRRIAEACGALFVADLYDNYEVFAAARIPGVKTLYRQALRKADLVTCISEPLRRHVASSGGKAQATLVVENAIDHSAFFPRNKAEARLQFQIPAKATVIGTAGALSTSRGISTFYDAFFALAREDETLVAAVAGPRDTPVPDHPRLIDAGHLAWAQVPVFLSALDVGVVCNKDSLFARHCFPQKAYEMLACDLPIVGADVGVMNDLLKDLPSHLFQPSDSASLAKALSNAITAGARPNLAIPTWDDLAARMEQAMQAKLQVTRGLSRG